MKKGLLLACWPCLLFSFGNPANGQEIENLEPPPGETTLIKRKSIVIVRKRTEKDETPGIELENFTLYPAFTLTEYYDDNVFAEDGSGEDDLITVITPSFGVKSKWKRHAINLDTGLEAVRHSELSSENTDNAWLDLDGNYELSDRDRVLAVVSYKRDHEDRASADSEVGEAPTEFDEKLFLAGITGNRDAHFYRLYASSRKFDYDDVDSSLGEIDYDDRDRDEGRLGLRYLYRYQSTLALFFELESDQRDYASSSDNEGNERSSDGDRYAAGSEFIASNVTARIYAGRLERDYDDIDFDDADELDLGWRLRWKYSDSTQLVLRSVHSIEETILNGSPGYLLRNTSLRLEYELSREKTLSFDAIDANADYFEIDREDDYLNFGVSYRQQLLPNLSYGVDLHRARRDSSVSGEDYRINQLFLRLRASL